jgi:hypothetical protein
MHKAHLDKNLTNHIIFTYCGYSNLINSYTDVIYKKKISKVLKFILMIPSITKN